MNNIELKKLLDELYFRYKKKHSSKDPVWNLHRLNDEKDVEILGLITSAYSYGSVDQINRFISALTDRTGFKLHEFTSNYSEHKDKKFLKGLHYRFNSEKDLSMLLINIKKVIINYGSLKNLFLEGYLNDDKNILNALNHFTVLFNNKQNKNIRTSYDYLVPSPENNSACKRLNLYLRWMIRKDEIDPGAWSGSIDKAKLIMPVDIHVYRISKYLKMVNRKSCDLKFAVELTEKLKLFDITDPVKYDFALCHYQMEK